MDRIFDPLVAAAAADIARHRFADLVVGRFWVFDEECGGLHDLAGLAKAALRDIDLAPGFLDGVIAGGMKALDRGDLAAGGVGVSNGTGVPPGTCGAAVAPAGTGVAPAGTGVEAER